MPVRMRATVRTTGDRAAELRTAADFRRDLWAHSPVEVDPDHPLHGTHRSEDGRAYFEFVTAFPEQARRVMDDFNYGNAIELSEAPALPGEECLNCGNVAGPIRPAVCPNCGFQDVSPCPICRQAVPRQAYIGLAGERYRCPHCQSRVRLRFNSPMFVANGDYNQPLVIVEEAAAVHEVR
ncbi:MAG: hypothetical protein JNM56_15785 [Planctomycetia bacterium]|nr:hypothetical protein [Planctomycetia bacterium]